MEQFHEDTTPFWLQTTNNGRHNRRHRRQSSPLLFNTGILIILLLAIAFAFIFIIIPSFQSFTSRVFKPQSLKKSWDSINLVLVLFAVICAFLSKNNGDYNDDNNNNETPNSYENYKFTSTPKHSVDDHVRTLNRSSSGRWFYDRSMSIDRTAYNSLRRMRSSSSYPDLRQESNWMMNGGDERLRFNDDSGLYDFRSRSRRERDEEQVYLNSLKDIAVDTVSTPSPPPYHPSSSPPHQPSHAPFPAPTQPSHPQSPQQFHPPLPPPTLPPQQPVTAAEPAPSPPPQYAKLATAVIVSPQQDPQPQLNPQPQFNTIARRKPKRIYENVQRKEVESSELKMQHSFTSSPPPVNSSSPPPLPPPSIDGSEKRGRKTKKKKGGATKDFLISLTRKKKHQRQRSVENLDEFFNLATLPLYPPPSPPPPPPPPPLPSFYNIFSSKKSKSRKQHSIPPPPPPPPPSQPSMIARASKRESNKPPVTIHKPPLPVKIKNVNNIEESVESGNDSPFRTIPPPPPPPPFKMPPWKFEVHGDYVRLKSINSSRSGSPDSDDPLSNEASPSDGNHGRESTAAGPLFCPSPDVNTKADNFIARFRAGLNLEKVNSVEGRSNLGLDPGPSTV